MHLSIANITVLSDSQAAVRVLCFELLNSETLNKRRGYLNEFFAWYKVLVIWVAQYIRAKELFRFGTTFQMNL